MALKRALVSTTTAVSTATQDVTESNAGFSSDVKCAIITGTGNTALDNSVNDARMNFCAAGSLGGAGHLAYFINEAVPPQSVSIKYDDNNDFYEHASLSATAVMDPTNPWLSNGIRLNWSVQNTAAHYFGALLLGGDIEAKVVHAGMGGSTSINVSHGLSGAPEVIIAWGNFAASPPDNFDRFTFGFWANNTHTGCSGRYLDAASAGAAALRLSTSWISGYVGSDGSLAYYYTISNVGASTFTLTNSSQSTSQYHSFLCLRGTSTPLTAKTGFYTSPTGTGNSSMGIGLGVAPSVLFMMPTAMTSVDTGSNTNSAGRLGMILACNRSGSAASQYFTSATTIDVGTGTVDPPVAIGSDKWCNVNEIQMHNPGGSVGTAATINAWQSDDVQLNFSMVTAAYKWPYLAFGMGDSPTITSAPSEFNVGFKATIVGTGFGASQGSGAVYLCPTNDVNDANRVQQTIVSWSNTTIVVTAVRGALSYDNNLYLFVKENGGTSNASGNVTQIKAGVKLVRTV